MRLGWASTWNRSEGSAEVDIGLVQHYDARETLGQAENLGVGEGIPRGVVGTAEEEGLGARVRGREQGLRVQAEILAQTHLAHLDVVGRGGYLIHAVTGADGDDVVPPGLTEDAEDEVDRLVTAVAHEDVVRIQALELGKALLQRFLVRVRVAVVAGIIRAFVGIQEDFRGAAALVARRAVGGDGRNVGTDQGFDVNHLAGGF